MRKKTFYPKYSTRGHLDRHYNYLWDKLKFEDYEYIVDIQKNGFPDIKTIKELRDKVRR